MSNLAARRRTSEPGVSVKYTPCSKDEHSDDELEEIAIVDKDEKPSSGQNSDSNCQKKTSLPHLAANGPKHLPGLGIFQAFTSSRDRNKAVGERLSTSGGRISLSSPVYSSKIVEQKSKSTSKQSLLDFFGTKIDRRKSRKSISTRSEFGLSLIRKGRSSEIITPREIRKIRRKEIEENFGKKSKRNVDRFDTSTATTDREGCNWTFVFDPAGRLSYWWSSVVSIAFLYNFWVIIYRYAFQEINSSNIKIWFPLDYTADLLYILDIAFHFRTGYLEDGVLQTDSVKLRIHYMNTTMFYIDCLCLLPLDFLYLSFGFYSIVRCFRLVKVYRFWAFLDRTERHTNYPNLIRTTTLMHYLLALFHWNACLYILVAKNLQASSNTWKIPKDETNVFQQYLHGLYWSTLTLTTIGNLPTPQTSLDYLFIITEMIFGLLLFATVLGHISNIVASISNARKDFQAKLDGVKTYMSLRRVPMRLQDRVIKWFDYLWYCNKSADEEKTLGLLPDKLKAEIAIHVHLDTLKRVEIFQNTEAGFLCELVLRLKPVLFSPGDYICRKGEVGKDMYIVNRGRLHVVGDNGKTVLATLKPGSYFGEISILNMGASGNRRTASVRSVGYSDLFRLSKQDLWDVLKEYPAARVKLEAIAVKRLEKTKKLPLESALARSKSTPGLVESAGKIPLESMLITRHSTLPAGLPSSQPLTTSHSVSGPCYTMDQHANYYHSQQSPPPSFATQDGVTADEPQTPSQQNVTIGTMTKSLTISSLTSFAGSPQQVSPEYSNPAKFTISPPISPGIGDPGQQLRTMNTPLVNNTMSYSSPAQLSPVHFPYSQSYSYGNHPQMNLLSPYCASSTLHPPSSPSLALTRSDNLSTSHTNLASPQMQSIHSPFCQNSHLSHSPSPNIPSVSPTSFTYDTSHDVLLQEITRLRERLVSLETENASMTVKLNQQQWDVEHRLAELEMHICQSDSVTSTTDQEDKIEPMHRESII